MKIPSSHFTTKSEAKLQRQTLRKRQSKSPKPPKHLIFRKVTGPHWKIALDQICAHIREEDLPPLPSISVASSHLGIGEKSTQLAYHVLQGLGLATQVDEVYVFSNRDPHFFKNMANFVLNGSTLEIFAILARPKLPFKLKHNAGRQAEEELAEKITKEIEKGTYPEGALMPYYLELGKILGFEDRSIVWRSYQRLVNKKYLTKTPQGYVVAKR